MRRNLKQVLAGCYFALAVLMAADAVLRLTHHAAEQGEAGEVEVEHGFWTRAYHLAEGMPVFWTIFGVLGCVLLVVVSKGLLAAVVARKEDYYGE
jgi:hypothetical protein